MQRPSGPSWPIYYFDIVHDYPGMGGVVEFSRILFRQLAAHYQQRLVSVRAFTAALGCAHDDMLYLDRERKVAEILAGIEPNAVFFFPNFQSPVARQQNAAGPAIINVIHDLQFAFLPDLFPPERRSWLHQTFAETKRNADRIVFISRSTKQDFIGLFGKPRRCSVIYNPIETHPVADLSDAATNEAPFLLASFHHHPHKNFPALLELFAALLALRPDVRLVVTGHGQERLAENLATLPDVVRSAIRHLGYVSRGELDALYRRADAFITVSRFEGFNMSAAEAACHGTPLILSDLPVHRELFGPNACMVDLTDSSARSAERVAAYLESRPRRTNWRFRSQCQPSSVRESYVRIIDSCRPAAR
jgi:glycosyltransferase involved in cell wall biosynthesis